MSLTYLPLTTYERMRRYIAYDTDTAPIAENVNRKRDLVNWIGVVSQQLAQYCNRNFLIGTYTEYFDVEYGKNRFPVLAYPITTITSIYEDPSGLFSTSTMAAISDSEYFNDIANSCVTLYRPLPYTATHALQIVYTGGLAASAANTLLTITASSGSMTAGNFIYGATSAALGIIRAYSALSITVEMLQGVFDSAESLEEHTLEACTDTAAHTATLSSVKTASLNDIYPVIVRAAEMQIRYNWHNKTQFGFQSATRDGATTKDTMARSGGETQLLKEVESMLMPYRRFRLS
jgi:hypothetical protein